MRKCQSQLFQHLNTGTQWSEGDIDSIDIDNDISIVEMIGLGVANPYYLYY